MSQTAGARPAPTDSRVRTSPVGTELSERADGRWTGWDTVELALAFAAFAVLCLLVLRTATYLAEPDDHAYQASIIAMTEGHFLSLTPAQTHALASQLATSGSLSSAGPGAAFGRAGGASGIVQWVRLADGNWISEKNPGYPFLAVVFQVLGIIRWTPLFYGGLACAGLFAGARRWLGRFGGAAAVGLYCSSGAALVFAWRDYMPTFTDGSLIAAGTGALLWAVLAADRSVRWRTLAGLAGFVALEAATFTRYTDILVLGCAVIAVLLAWRLRTARLPGVMVAWWLGSVAVSGAGIAAFDTFVYGGPLQTGYRPGEITFALSAIAANLRSMPAHLVSTMPLLVLSLAALAWIIWRWLRFGRQAAPHDGTSVPVLATTAGSGTDPRFAVRLDLAVGLALAGSWLAMWGLYSAYTWTTGAVGGSLHVIRFYVPALAAMALLGAWLVTRLPGRGSSPALAVVACAAVLAGLFVLGNQSFHQMVTSATRPSRSCAALRPGGARPGGVPGTGQGLSPGQGPGAGQGQQPGAGPGRLPGSGRCVNLAPGRSRPPLS